jgi:hypothetical protein
LAAFGDLQRFATLGDAKYISMAAQPPVPDGARFYSIAMQPICLLILASLRQHQNESILIWYAECLKKSVKREALERWQRKKALGCEAGGGYDSSSGSHDVRNLPYH